MKVKILVLLLGILIGLGAAVIFPAMRQRLTPTVLKSAPTQGVVEDKRSEPDRLLLTVVTPGGAVLATFTKRVPEIDLLVEPGDTVSLALGGYRPFVEDPEIERVVKAPLQPEEPPPPAEPRAEGPTDPGAESLDDPQAEGLGDLEAEIPSDPPAERSPGTQL